jgi:acid phosphatase
VQGRTRSSRAVGLAIAAVAAVAAVGLTACTGSAGSSSSPATGSDTQAAPDTQGGGPPVPRWQHLVVAVLENEDADAVLGSGDAPWLDAMAARGATLTDMHGETHPSQGNYVALFSGSTHGVTDDGCPLRLDGPTLAGQLADAGLTFTGYAEGLPAAGSDVCRAGDYARKHAPWTDFPAVPAEVGQPWTAWPADPAQLPTVAVVVPDLCHDAHDCGLGTADDWARQHLGPYADWASTHDSLLVLTFDEDEGSKANHIATVLVGAGVRPGSITDRRADHYSLLRTVEDSLGLPPIGEAASRAPLSGIWSAP